MAEMLYMFEERLIKMYCRDGPGRAEQAAADALMAELIAEEEAAAGKKGKKDKKGKKQQAVCEPPPQKVESHHAPTPVGCGSPQLTSAAA